MGYIVRVLLLFILAWFIARAIWHVIAGVIVGASAPPPAADRNRRVRRGPEQGVRMVRDPECGTFLPPADALAVTGRDGVTYFCSEACRRKHEAKASGARS